MRRAVRDVRPIAVAAAAFLLPVLVLGDGVVAGFVQLSVARLGPASAAKPAGCSGFTVLLMDTAYFCPATQGGFGCG